MAVTVAPITSSPSEVTLPLMPEVVICAMATDAYTSVMTTTNCNLFNILSYFKSLKEKKQASLHIHTANLNKFFQTHVTNA